MQMLVSHLFHIEIIYFLLYKKGHITFFSTRCQITTIIIIRHCALQMSSQYSMNLFLIEFVK